MSGKKSEYLWQGCLEKGCDIAKIQSAGETVEKTIGSIGEPIFLDMVTLNDCS